MQRTENDSWDLATSVGATATMVAAGRARAHQNGFIDDRFAEPLVRAVGIDFFTRWASGELDFAEIDVSDNPWSMQLMNDLMVARTRYIDEFFAAAVSTGIRQAVILASGLDARGYRVSWPEGMTLFEIDQPQVLDFKATTLAALGAEPTTELRSVPIDLRDDWPAALRGAGFDAERPTAWSAEGLLAFLSPDAQDRLLDNITALSAAGSRLVAEVFFLDDGEQVTQAALRRWYDHGLDVSLDHLGYLGERSDVATYLDARGWTPTCTALDQLLAENGFPAPCTAGEYFCIATR